MWSDNIFESLEIVSCVSPATVAHLTCHLLLLGGAVDDYQRLETVALKPETVALPLSDY